MDQIHKKAFLPTDSVVFMHTGGMFTLLENRALLAFPNSVIEDASLFNGIGKEKEAEELTLEEEEERKKATSFELEIEDDTELKSL